MHALIRENFLASKEKNFSRNLNDKSYIARQ